jgi:subtilisin family serine protease
MKNFARNLLVTLLCILLVNPVRAQEQFVLSETTEASETTESTETTKATETTVTNEVTESTETATATATEAIDVTETTTDYLPKNTTEQSVTDTASTLYESGEVIVKYKKSVINLDTKAGQAKAETFAEAQSVTILEDIEKSNIVVVEITDEQSVMEKIADLEKNPAVEYAEPNYKRFATTITANDTHRQLLWGLDNAGQTIPGSPSSGGTVTGINDADIDAPEAWLLSESSTSTTPVIVAVIDDGVAYNHPDLASNMWDGIDCKTENGLALGNCMHGYDFASNDKMPLPNDSTHGTHIAGTIAAVKNNTTGIIGVAPQAKIMAIKFDYTVATEIKAIDFAIQNGAKIINASYTGASSSQAEYDAINRFKNAGGIFVAAAGNQNNNTNQTPNYPANYDLDNIIVVAATNQNDVLAPFSNYGSTTVDVGAPGVNIYSTVATESVVFSETFESTATSSLPAGFTPGGTNNNWGTIVQGGIGWGTTLKADLAVPYSNNRNTTVSSPTITLGQGGATLDFRTQCDTQYNTTSWVDYLQLEFSSDGVNFTPATYKGDVFRWDEATLDIYSKAPLDGTSTAEYHFTDIIIPDQYLTNTFKFQLRWVTDDSDNNYTGCVVDNIKITKFSDGSDGQYGYVSGTSMAAPHVAGLTALLSAYNPLLTPEELKTIILTSGDTLPSLVGKTVSGKRINAERALVNGKVPVVPTPDTVAPVITLNGSPALTLTLNQTFTDPGATALDAIDGDVTSKIIVSGVVNTLVSGIYVLTYTVSDTALNTAQATRTVTIQPQSSGGGGSSSGGGGGGSSSGGGGGGGRTTKKPVPIKTPAPAPLAQILGAATSTPTTTTPVAPALTQAELLVTLKQQLVSLMMQLILLLQANAAK